MVVDDVVGTDYPEVTAYDPGRNCECVFAVVSKDRVEFMRRAE
jgi:hypothetical protein